MDSMFIGQIKRSLNERDLSEFPALDPRIQPVPPPVIARSSVGSPMEGYLISVQNERALKGYFLVFPGNSQPIKTIINKLLPIADFGYDVIAFDYRGLLHGNKVPTIKELIEDARTIVAGLNTNARYTGKEHVLYAMSSGGVFALQALKYLSPGDTVILDSVPDKLPFILWCDSIVHPKGAINSQPLHGLHIAIVHSMNDAKVKPLNSRVLIATAESAGGCHRLLSSGVHPFEDGDDTSSRIQEILQILTPLSPCRRQQK